MKCHFLYIEYKMSVIRILLLSGIQLVYLRKPFSSVILHLQAKVLITDWSPLFSIWFIFCILLLLRPFVDSSKSSEWGEISQINKPEWQRVLCCGNLTGHLVNHSVLGTIFLSSVGLYSIMTAILYHLRIWHYASKQNSVKYCHLENCVNCPYIMGQVVCRWTIQLICLCEVGLMNAGSLEDLPPMDFWNVTSVQWRF